MVPWEAESFNSLASSKLNFSRYISYLDLKRISVCSLVVGISFIGGERYELRLMVEALNP